MKAGGDKSLSPVLRACIKSQTYPHSSSIGRSSLALRTAVLCFPTL